MKKGPPSTLLMYPPKSWGLATLRNILFAVTETTEEGEEGGGKAGEEETLEKEVDAHRALLIGSAALAKSALSVTNMALASLFSLKEIQDLFREILIEICVSSFNGLKKP